VCYCFGLLYFSVTRLYLLPLFKTIALKLFNHDYSEPSDQGLSESCTLHAISKAVVSFMDKKMIDVKQDWVETVLLACIGSSDRQWPSTFNEKEIEIEGTIPNESNRKVNMKIKLSINCVVTTNQIPNEKFEYILCTSYLSPEDFHSVYIEKKVEETGLLHCINSWGPENKPHPVILIGDHSNKFYRVQMTIIPQEEPDFTQAVLDLISVSKFKQTADFWK
jgi:hypothetical protein